MRRLAPLAAVAFVATALLASPAHADPPGAAGLTCGLVAGTDPSGLLTSGPSTYVGTMFGGPVAVADPPRLDSDLNLTWDIGGNPASATITCAVQVNGSGAYTDPDAMTVTSPRTPVVADLLPTLVTFTAAPTDSIWVCTTLELTDAHGDSVTVYYDVPSGTFRQSPSIATCGIVLSTQYPPPELCEAVPPLCDNPVFTLHYNYVVAMVPDVFVYDLVELPRTGGDLALTPTVPSGY